MKSFFTTSVLSTFFVVTLQAQTLTYSNFSASLSQTLSVNLADNASYNNSLSTTIGNNVTWDASGLTVQLGTPTIQLSYHNSSSTPHASLYPGSNYCEYDPDLLSVVSYNYMAINTDSMVQWGSYASNGAHEIFENPDKRLVFPFAFGQSFTDTYAKTNYSNANTISSYQTGTRTVTFAGYGTLILPQGTFTDVALITEMRTNSLGPNSVDYNWIRVADGKRLLFRSENNGAITTAWCNNLSSALDEGVLIREVAVFPNPVSTSQTNLTIQSATAIDEGEWVLFDYTGKEKFRHPVNGNTVFLKNELPSAGLYFYVIYQKTSKVASGKLIIE